MEKLKVKPISVIAFEKYGQFHSMLNPDTEKLAPGPVEFHRDIVKISLGRSNQPSFSVTHISKRPLIVEKLEYHNYTGEAFMPLDGDVIIHLAPASRPENVPYDKIEAFYIPKGTLVTIHPGVWHQAPYAAGEDTVNVLVVLPERTYVNDCKVVLLEEAHRLILEKE